MAKKKQRNDIASRFERITGHKMDEVETVTPTTNSFTQEQANRFERITGQKLQSNEINEANNDMFTREQASRFERITGQKIDEKNIINDTELLPTSKSNNMTESELLQTKNTGYSVLPTIESNNYAESLKKQKKKEAKAEKKSAEKAKEIGVDTKYISERGQEPTRSSAINENLSKPLYERPAEKISSMPDYNKLAKREQETLSKQKEFFQSKEYNEYLDEKYTTPLYQYYADMEKAENTDVSTMNFLQKTGETGKGGLTRGLPMFRSQYKTTNQFGETIYVTLPSYSEMVSQKIVDNTDSGIGKLYYKAVDNVGQMLPNIAISLIPYVGQTASLAELGVSSYAQNYNARLLNGEKKSNASTRALISSAIEVGTEKMFGGMGEIFGKGELDKVLIDSVKSKVKSRVGKFITELGLSSVGEGFEELVGSSIERWLADNVFKDEDLPSWKEWGKETLEEFMVAAVSSAMMSAGSASVKSVRKSNIDNYVINNIQEKTGTKLSVEEKNNVMNVVDNLYENKVTDANLILYAVESGNTDLSALKDTQLNIYSEQIKETENKFNEVKDHIAALEEKNSKLPNANIKEELNKLKNESKELSQTLAAEKIVRDDLMAYDIENANLRSEAYSNDSNPIDIYTASIKNAQNAGIVINDNVKQILQAASNRGVNIVFDPNLDENSNGVWSETRNEDGSITRTITFNRNTIKNYSASEVFVHELFHDIASSNEGKTIINEVINLLENDSRYNSEYLRQRALLEAEYAKLQDADGNLLYDPNSEDFKSKIDEEITAIALQEQLGNKEFINQLVQQKPNLAKRIYNWVKNLIENFQHRNDADYKFWNEVKTNFEKAYQSEYKESISGTEKHSNNIEKNAEIEYNIDGNLDKYKSSTLFNQMMQKSQPGIAEELMVNDYNNYYEISKNEENGYEIISRIPITDNNADYIKLIQSEIKEDIENVVERGKGNNSSFEEIEDRSRYDNWDNVENQREETISEFVDRILEDIERERNKNNDFAKGKRNNELDNSSFSLKQKQNDTRYSINIDGKLFDNKTGKDVKLKTADTGSTGTLMAIHNLSEDKMKGILELGGFPVPSIAITNPNITNHKSFGDISVLFDKSTIDPAIKSNEVYDRDVWSPTFPTVDSEIIKDNLEKVADEIGIRDYYLEDYAERNSNVEDLIYTVLREDDVVNKYLDRNNINYDKDLSRKEIRQIAIDNGINEYLKDKLKDIFGEKGIYNGKEYITSSGKRRTFWQTHDKYNLANIVKILTRKSTINGQDTSIFSGGFGNIQANMSQRFNSIQEIKNAETRLKSTADNDIKPLQDNLSDSISKLTEYYGGYTSSNPFTTFSKVSEDIVDFASKKEQNISTLREMLDEYGYKKVPDSILNGIVKSINDLKNIPTDYFEAKPQRAVGLDEVQQIVIPNTLDAEFKKQLQDAGLQYTEYDPNIEGDRQRVINQFDELKFSRNVEGIDTLTERKGTKTQFEKVKLPKAEINLPKASETTNNQSQVELNNNDEMPFDDVVEDTTKSKKTDNQRVTKLQAQTDTAPMNSKTINQITRNMKKALSLNNSEVGEFKQVLYEISQNPDISKNEIQEIIDRRFSSKSIQTRIEDVADIKKQLKDYPISVSQEIKSDIADYSRFRQENFGKIKFSKDGTSVDQAYQELHEMFPTYFPDSIKNPTDQLEQISYVANMDNYITQNVYLDDATISDAADWIFDSIQDYKLAEQVKNNQISYKEYSKALNGENLLSRDEIRAALLSEMGITEEDIAQGKDINAIDLNRTDPIRVNEKVFGYKIGQKINDATINQTKHNEAERTRWLNAERTTLKDLGIKARSKESAAVQKYGEKQYITEKGEVRKYDDKQLAIEFPDVATQNKIKNAANVIRNKYDSYIDQINSVLTEMGYKKINKRQDYMRHFQALNDVFSRFGTPLNRESLQSDSLPTDINGLTDQFKPGKQYFASALKRMGMKTQYDAISGIDGYLEGASNLIFHTEDIQRYRTLSKLIRDTYGSMHGYDNVDNMTEEQFAKRVEDIQSNKLAKYAAWLDEQANALANKKGKVDRGAEELLGRKVYSILNTAKKQVGSNMTGYNVRSAMTNFASAIQGASKTNKLAFIKGTISTINNIIHRDSLIDKSDFLTSRFGSDSLSLKPWQKASQAGQIFMTGTDYFTANQVWRGKYFENLQKGMSETEAIKQADDFAARIMGDRSKGATATMFNSQTLGFFTQFQLEVNNQWSSLIHDNKIDIQKGNKSAATVLFQMGQLFGFSYLFNNLMKTLTGSDVMIDPIDLLKKIFKPDDDDDKDMAERAFEAVGELIDDIPFVSTFTGGRIPMGEAFKGATTLTKKLTGQTDKFGNTISVDDVKKDLIESGFYWLLPTGYGQLRKAYKGLSMYDKKLPVAGSYTDSGNLRFTAENTTSGKIRATLFGAYSSKEADDYINSGYQTIKASRINEMKELGMTSSEYRKYQNDLKTAQKTKIETDNGTYEMYTDKNNNWYWYNVDEDIVYRTNNSIFDTNSLKITNLNVDNLKKVSKSQGTYDYVMNMSITDKQKAMLLNNELRTENMKRREYTVQDIQQDYNSLEEMNYAIDNPEWYSFVKQVAPYDEYMQYRDEINTIRRNTTNDKVETINYINNLKLTVPQKAMFIRTYYKSFTNYDSQIINYVNQQSISAKEKQDILTKAGFKIRDGRVYSK